VRGDVVARFSPKNLRPRGGISIPWVMHPRGDEHSAGQQCTARRGLTPTGRPARPTSSLWPHIHTVAEAVRLGRLSHSPGARVKTNETLTRSATTGCGRSPLRVKIRVGPPANSHGLTRLSHENAIFGKFSRSLPLKGEAKCVWADPAHRREAGCRAIMPPRCS